MTRFSKLAAASAAACTLAGAGIPAASAAVLGGAGEALLVPLAVWAPGRFSDPNCSDDDFTTICRLNQGYTPAVDTIFEVWIPEQVGQEAIPNNYTAIHTTPTAIGGAPPTNTVNWFWFGKRGELLDRGTVVVGPDVVAQISLTEVAGGQDAGEPGYMVFTTDQSSNNSQSGANFAFFANAWITGGLSFDQPVPTFPFFTGIGFPFIGGTIPVLAMNDGPDAPAGTAVCPPPSPQDRVTYSGQVPCLVSPSASGFRPGNGNGLQSTFVFDLALSDRYSNTIHVIWFDQNPDKNQVNGNPWPGNVPSETFGNVYPDNLLQFAGDTAQIEVFNTTGFLPQGASVDLPNRLNVLWIPPANETDPDNLAFINQPFEWVTDTLILPFINDPAVIDFIRPGFASYTIDEYVDSGPNANGAEIAMFAFALKYSALAVNNDAVNPDIDAIFFMVETSLGHDRGNFD